ncbi:hypothetical protein DL89DRAFT_266589 [Linderina pennispora]|uniref:Uncharacterized protein n=1 Tax=Linderina pennispora TaxID=61395 RepID=A0A1Y1WE39_9FUNG|nr:uncharacterized protein DL89DRAFT_266589 [Linderina pennispora]ORX71588.1 hypothetical protein DL89DRAFT_266589 [Linderina pennispora]
MWRQSIEKRAREKGVYICSLQALIGGYVLQHAKFEKKVKKSGCVVGGSEKGMLGARTRWFVSGVRSDNDKAGTNKYKWV